MIAVIPARSGSKGVPNKNIKILAGIPLLAHSILFAKKIKSIRRIIVSTDSIEYSKIAKYYGAEVPFLRPKEISKDDSIDLDFFLHLIDHLKIKNEDLIHFRPTTPLRDFETVVEAIKIFENSRHATSLRSGHKAPETPFKWMMRDSRGFFKPLLKSH